VVATSEQVEPTLANLFADRQAALRRDSHVLRADLVYRLQESRDRQLAKIRVLQTSPMKARWHDPISGIGGSRAFLNV